MLNSLYSEVAGKKGSNWRLLMVILLVKFKIISIHIYTYIIIVSKN